MTKQLYTTFEAAKLLGITPDTVLKWIKSGKISASRTCGGHYRIRRYNLSRLIAERQLQELTTPPPFPSRAFQYCWEFNSITGAIQDDCRDCLVYQSRAKLCYKLNCIPKELGHPHLFCVESCDDCEYYKHVESQALEIIVITDDKNFLDEIDTDKTFNFRITNNEYQCSAIVEKIRPEVAIIDCTFSNSEAFYNYLSGDSRVPFLQFILVSGTEINNSVYHKNIIGRFQKPLTTRQLEDLVSGVTS